MLLSYKAKIKKSEFTFLQILDYCSGKNLTITLSSFHTLVS